MDLPAGYEVETSEVVFTSRFNTVRVDKVRMPDGELGTREIVEHMAAVGAVAIDGEGRVILVRQYRHAFGRHLLEIPAGVMDLEGEDPAEGAQRELAEEVLVRAGTLAHLVTFNNSAGWNNEHTHVYLATDLEEVPRPEGFVLAHEEADMEVLRVPLQDAVQMVLDGEITDAKTVVGILTAHVRRLAGP